MTRFVAFLRAMNVGGHTVTMTELHALVSGLGLEDVETFIASGNVVVSADESAAVVEETIRSGLTERLGYPVDTFVRTPAQLAKIAAAAPFGELADGHKVQVGFLTDPLPQATGKALVGLSNDYDSLVAKGREVYWLTRGGISKSLIKPAVFARTLGVPTTMRNVTTVHRLVHKYPPD